MTNNNYETPQSFFKILDDEFHFTLDVCALPETAKCERFFTMEIDGLKQDWTSNICWMNPPYGRGVNVYKWVEKAYNASLVGSIVVALLRASTDTKWFHEFCLKAFEIRFIKDRLHFNGRANHANIVVVFRQSHRNYPLISSIGNGR
jgi:phage N-6-adenine-methyltransferase